MLRLFTALVTVFVGMPSAIGSELILTGISASGGIARAYFSSANGASAFSLKLHEDYAGIRLVRVNRRAQRVWIVESGEGRWMGLGDPKSAASQSPATTAGFESAGGSGTPGSDLRGPMPSNGLNARSLGLEAGTGTTQASSTDAAQSGTDGASSTAPHRWRPGIVREPNAAELYRTQYGATALETAIRNGQIPRE